MLLSINRMINYSNYPNITILCINIRNKVYDFDVNFNNDVNFKRIQSHV